MRKKVGAEGDGAPDVGEVSVPDESGIARWAARSRALREGSGDKAAIELVERGTYGSGSVVYTVTLTMEWQDLFALEPGMNTREKALLTALGRKRVSLSSQLEALALIARKLEERY